MKLMFNIINSKNNTMFYSSNSSPLNKLTQKYTNTPSSPPLITNVCNVLSVTFLFCTVDESTFLPFS